MGAARLSSSPIGWLCFLPCFQGRARRRKTIETAIAGGSGIRAGHMVRQPELCCITYSSDDAPQAVSLALLYPRPVADWLKSSHVSHVVARKVSPSRSRQKAALPKAPKVGVAAAYGRPTPQYFLPRNSIDVSGFVAFSTKTRRYATNTRGALFVPVTVPAQPHHSDAAGYDSRRDSPDCTLNPWAGSRGPQI